MKTKKSISFFLALLLTLNLVPVTAFAKDNNNHDLIVSISNGEILMDYIAIQKNDDLYFKAEDYGQFTRYEYSDNENQVFFSLGDKRIIINKEDGSMQIPCLSYYDGSIDLYKESNAIYIAASDLLPWLNVECSVENNTLFIVPDTLTFWEVTNQLSYDQHIFNLYREYGDSTSAIVGLSAMMVFDTFVNLRWDRLVQVEEDTSLYDYHCYVETMYEIAKDETLLSETANKALKDVLSVNKGISTIEEIFDINEKELALKGDQLLLDMGFDAESMAKYYDLTNTWIGVRESLTSISDIKKYFDPLKILCSYEAIAKSNVDYLSFITYLNDGGSNKTVLEKAIQEVALKLDKERGFIYSWLIDLGSSLYEKNYLENGINIALQSIINNAGFLDNLSLYLDIANVFYSTVIPVTSGYEGMSKVGAVSAVMDHFWDTAGKLSNESMTEENLTLLCQSYLSALKASKQCYSSMQDTMDVKLLGIVDLYGGEGAMDYQIDSIEDLIVKFSSTALTRENDSISGKTEAKDSILTLLSSLKLVHNFPLTELLNQPFSKATALFGDNYASDSWYGGRRITFNQGLSIILETSSTVWNDPINSDETIAIVISNGNRELIPGLHGGMTFVELEDALREYDIEITFPEPQYDPEISRENYSIRFNIADTVFHYSWMSDPSTSHSYYSAAMKVKDEPAEITEEEAEKIAKDYWGEADSDEVQTSIVYQGIKFDENGERHHYFILKWFVIDHWSAIDYLYVNVLTGEPTYPS